MVNSLVLLNLIRKMLKTSQESLHSSPLVLFDYAGTVLGFFVIVTWNICFWRKTTQFTKLVYETSSYKLFPDKIFFQFKKVLLCLFPLIITLLAYLCELKISTGSINLPENFGKIPVFTQELKWQNLLLLVKQIPLCCSIYMGACFDVLTIVIAISVHDFKKTHLRTTGTRSNLRNIPEVTEMKPNVKKMVRDSKEIQAYFGDLNDFFSNLFLIWFWIEFPWIPSQMVRISTIETYGIIDVIRVVYTLMCTSFYVVTGILFSESRKNVSLSIENLKKYHKINSLYGSEPPFPGTAI